MLPRRHLSSWYKQLWEFKADKRATSNELRWEIAYALYKFIKNYQTAAHLILNLNWDNKNHVPALRTMVARMEEQPALPTKKAFRKAFGGSFIELEEEDDG